jgi:hypothetical protein
MAEICQPRSEQLVLRPSAQRAEQQSAAVARDFSQQSFFCNNFHSLNWERIHLPQLTAAQELQIKAQKRLASLMEEKLVTRISVLSTLLGGAKQPNDFSSLPACVPISLEYRQHRAKQQDVAMAVERGRVQTVPRNGA